MIRTMRTTTMAVALAMALAMVLAACGDDSTPPAEGSTGAASTGAASTSGASTGGVDSTGAAESDSSGGTETGGPTDSTFPPMGPLVGDAGRGSFRFGAASAATQIEDQNPDVDWYVWTAPAPDGLGNGTFVGEASRGFSMALEDLDLIADLGLDTYRFSIEWARIEPQRDVIDEAALAHYDAFIDGLIARGIRPMITVHHFSNPIWIDDPRDPTCAAGPTDDNLCGWDHDTGAAEVIAELAEHATLLAQRYGDRVDEWGTINEPINYMLAGYGLDVFPPGKSTLLADFEGRFLGAIRNYISGHAAAYDAIKAADTTDADGDGIAAAVGLTKGAVEWLPARDNEVSDHPDDVAGRDRIDYLYNFMFVDAIVQGAFDAELDGVFEEPHPEWEGRIDWIGVQYYLRAGVATVPAFIPVVQATPCFSGFDFGACVPELDPTYHVPAMEYEHWPQGLYERLMAAHERWAPLPMIVSESGIATEVGERRAEAIVRALESIEQARDEGADVRGYYHWSIYDNFEWAEGYVPRFGLYTVDYGGSYGRTATLGATVLAEITTDRTITVAQHETYGGEGPMTPER